MNLLIDAWIPIHRTARTELITLQEVLCNDEPKEIALSRDDMELACLQLLICLTQVLFIPVDKKAWRGRIGKPLTAEEYESAITPYLEWFDLIHPDTPFMQVRGVKAKEMTRIQKLFIGLPEGNNHAFFNDAGEIKSISQSAAAILLFNQAMNSPSFGGGFKGGFRGGAPITTLMSGDTLRHTIWFNVLHEQSVIAILPDYEKLKENDKPTWIDLIGEKSTINAHEIGLLRGLFWQPAHIELDLSEISQSCDFYALSIEEPMITGFKKEKFVYNIVGDWIHPHSPRTLELKTKKLRYRSFTTTAPAWTQLNHLVVQSEDKKAGHIPATVITQFHELASSDQLIVGGYRNKQASILQRRHESFPLRSGWDKNGAQIKALIEAAIEVKSLLRNKLYGFAKASGAEGVYEKAEDLFYQRSEELIHQFLRKIEWAETPEFIKSLRKELINLSWEICNQVTQPYQHEPKMIKALTVTKATLGSGFKKIQGDNA